MQTVRINEEIKDFSCDMCGAVDWREWVKQEIQDWESVVSEYFCNKCYKAMSLFPDK